MIIRPNGKPHENPAAEKGAPLTERSRNQTQDHHDVRAGGVASRAYADGWDRIWAKGKGKRHGE